MLVRHGDILLKLCQETVPKDLTMQDTVILAEGEVTGHFHKLKTKTKAVGKWSCGGIDFIVLNENGTITHEEHSKVTVKKGVYEVIHEQEYDPLAEQINKVID